MKQESKRLSSIIIAALVVAGALVVYFEFIVPTYTNLESLKGQVESEAAAYANESTLVSQVKSLLTTYKSDASSSQAVAMALPVGPDVSGALAQIYGIASDTGLPISGTTVSTQAVQTVTPLSTGGSTTAGSIIKPTGTISFQINGVGSYESIKNFLQGLATNIRIFNVTGVTLQPSMILATKTQAANSDNFTYSIMVVTYYQTP
jgi:Tfp pilus assembly protein PilO